ncbi:MAG: hypothetical protein GX568_09170 [Candidatus Gastranaerophilales bacterium]|nr:hypothetical protein [Candidatus Gastranaerophilales bacterium]
MAFSAIAAVIGKVAAPILKQVAVGAATKAATNVASNATSGNSSQQAGGADLGKLLDPLGLLKGLTGGDKNQESGGVLGNLLNIKNA